MTSLVFILSVFSAYIIGSFPTSFILTKLLKGIDIREAGSKNVGATNVLRVVGKVPAIIALVTDILKGVFTATLVANFFYPSLAGTPDFISYRAILGFVTICGHVWPVFLGFKGGKGIATTIGVLTVVAPLPLGLALLIWLVLFLATSFVSVASIALAISLPIFATFLSRNPTVIILTAAICILTTYKHSENIRRLLRGEESKTLLFKR